MDKILSEITLFRSKPLNMRVLLLTNLLYIAVIPISQLLISVYVLRNSGNDMGKLAIYQLASYIAIPLAFWLNGLLLNAVRIDRLFSFGMMLSAVSMLLIMMLNELTVPGLACAGFLMSMSSGFYWANRDILALVTTTDSTRSYFYGVDQFFGTMVTVATPFLIGTLFLANVDEHHWLGMSITQAYHVVVGLVFVLVFISCWMIHQGEFQNPKKANFVFFKFSPIWKRLQVLTIVRGMTQGYMAMAPTLLIVALVGKEGAVGMINSIGGIVSAAALYIIGRTTGPQHRVLIYSVAVVAFAIGALTNALLFSATGVFIFIALQTLSQPLQEISYFGTQMRVIDVTAHQENRPEYAYIFNLEFSYLLGRCGGLIFFLLLINQFSETFALRYALAVVAVAQLGGIFLVKNLIKKCNQDKAQPQHPVVSKATLRAVEA
jgi:YQGE family putative transporter